MSASRIYVMEKYNLESDECEYRFIRFNNSLQYLTCLCDVASDVDSNFRDPSTIIDYIADLVYHILSGCMTAQTANEINYQDQKLRTGIQMEKPIEIMPVTLPYYSTPEFYPHQQEQPLQVYPSNQVYSYQHGYYPAQQLSGSSQTLAHHHYEENIQHNGILPQQFHSDLQKCHQEQNHVSALQGIEYPKHAYHLPLPGAYKSNTTSTSVI